MKLLVQLAVLSFVAGMAQAATTFAELQAEVAAAADGATVYVENDMSYTGALANGLGKRFTLASPAGQTNRLTRASTFTNGLLMKLSDAADDVTIRDLVIDGNRSTGPQSEALFHVTNGQLTLESGTELRNVKRTAAGSIYVAAQGRIVMNEGAVIRGFVNEHYGTVVLIEKKQDVSGVFTMNGGLITDCESTRTVVDQYGPAGYGGVVYNLRGRLQLLRWTHHGQPGRPGLRRHCRLSRSPPSQGERHRDEQRRRGRQRHQLLA